MLITLTVAREEWSTLSQVLILLAGSHSQEDVKENLFLCQHVGLVFLVIHTVTCILRIAFNVILCLLGYNLDMV